jgi:hypothetical protein
MKNNENAKQSAKLLVVGIIIIACATTALLAACAGTTTKSCGQNRTDGGFDHGCQSDWVWTKTYTTYETCTIEYATGAMGCEQNGTNQCTETIEMTYSIETPPSCVSGTTTNQWPIGKSKPNNVPCPPPVG